jgi:hypothetical protein
MNERTDADRQREAEALADQALTAAPGMLSAVVEIVTGLAGLMTGRKVIAVQHIERPHDERDNPGLGQWDSYVRVLDQDDADDTAGNA